jgi:diguanylate cyclase (GGDEF)-like protein
MTYASAKALHPLRLRHVPERADRRWLSGTLTVGLLAVMGMSFLVGFVISGGHQAELGDYRSVTRDIRTLQAALVDAETGVRGFVLTEQFAYLEPYFSGLRTVDERGPVLLPQLDESAGGSVDISAERHPISHRIAELRRLWLDAVSLAENHQAAAAGALLEERQEKQVMDELRVLFGTYIGQRNEEASRAESRVGLERQVLLGVNLSGALIAIVALIYAFRRSLRETSRREAAMAESEQTAERVDQLFGMTSILQSATDRDDANEVLRATTIRLLPGFSGRLYIFNNSHDRLELSTAWGLPETAPRLDHVAPSTCWAMKRGKPHLNVPGEGALRCAHHPESDAAALEIPMSARGEVLGLLVIGAGEHDTVAALRVIQPLAAALADGMSLALSSITLREQLRNQALRDPLTGLYNRRFLEETLQRLGLDAHRRKAPLAAIMIDLDHFKKLNDQYGHATGDIVLQAVSSTIVSVLRATDIVCRYGGEELAVLLPDCPLEMATAKAELLRASIEDLVAGPSGATVTASLGVAAIPATTSAPASLLASADAALYQAKQEGRNRVVQAASKMSATNVFVLDAVEA